MVTAYIVARGGSKGIPRKNLALLGGLPLLAHTCRAAAQARGVERVILDTEDDEIARVGREHGAETPYRRPAELAGDRALVMDVTLHALQWLADHERYTPDYVMLLQPTSPFRTAADIDAAIDLARDRNAEAVVSVSPLAHHPWQAKVVDAAGRLQPFIPHPLAAARRQDLPPVYALNGAIYLVRRETLLAGKTWCPDGALAYVMPPERALDIDTPWDLRVARGVLAAPAAG